MGNPHRFSLGATTSNKNVTEQSAMQMTDIYACVRVLVETVSGLPLHIYEYRSDDGKQKAIIML